MYKIRENVNMDVLEKKYEFIGIKDNENNKYWIWEDDETTIFIKEDRTIKVTCYRCNNNVFSPNLEVLYNLFADGLVEKTESRNNNTTKKFILFTSLTILYIIISIFMINNFEEITLYLYYFIFGCIVPQYIMKFVEYLDKEIK